MNLELHGDKVKCARIEKYYIEMCVYTLLNTKLTVDEEHILSLFPPLHGSLASLSREKKKKKRSQFCQCNVVRQWIAKPSWHKLNHQNCVTACQAKMHIPSCVMCRVRCALYDDLLLSRAVLLHKRSIHVRACMLCKVSCLLLRNMPCRKLPVSLLLPSPVYLIDRGGR